MVVQLLDMAPTGEAIGRVEGMVVFVPFGLPGEEVEVELVHRRRRFARGQIRQVLRPAAERVMPLCPYFGRCGGCEWQHAAYTVQLAFKTRAVREQLSRIAHMPDVDIRPCLASPQEFGYRNHIQFVLSPRGRPGFFMAGSKTVIEVEECPISSPLLNQLFSPQPDSAPTLTQSIAAVASANELDSLAEVHLRAGVRTGERMIIMETKDGEHKVLAGDPPLHERIKPWQYEISPGSFFQVNTPATERLVDAVLAALALDGAENVLELYCGVGLFTLPISTMCAQVLGIESSSSAARDALHNLAGRPNARILNADAGQALTMDDVQRQPWDVIVLDPPRAGVQRETLAQVHRLKAGRITYISCDPATLARDARVLCDSGYALDYVQPLDMFPQTHHVESIALFTLPAGGYKR